MTSTPVAAEIGRRAVERIQIMRAKGRCAEQIAADLELDVYVVDEVFAWHDSLCGLAIDDRADEQLRLCRRQPKEIEDACRGGLQGAPRTVRSVAEPGIRTTCPTTTS